MIPQILLEDGPLLAVNKPAGLLTQGVPAGLPTLEGWVKEFLKQKYQKPGNVYLGIPHRLDRPVSGVIVFARNSKAAARLAEQFRERQVRKYYLCVVRGNLPAASGCLVDWLLKDSEQAHVTSVPEDTQYARRAELNYEQLATVDGYSLVRIELLTGRMHQIRVQLATRGCPIVGDLQYGDLTENAERTGLFPKERERILLHSAHLELSHPIRYDRLQITAEIPDFWQSLPEWSALAEQAQLAVISEVRTIPSTAAPIHGSTDDGDSIEA